MIRVTRIEPPPIEPTFGIEGLSQRQFQLIKSTLEYRRNQSPNSLLGQDLTQIIQALEKGGENGS